MAGIDKPTDNIRELAVYAIANERAGFRRAAAKRDKFVEAVRDERGTIFNKKPLYDIIDDLSDEEESFILGWMFLAEREYLGENGEIDDNALVEAIRKQINFEPGMMTG